MRSRWMWQVMVILAATALAAGANEAGAGGCGRNPVRSGGGPRGASGPGAAVADDEMRAALEQVMRVRCKQVLQLTPEQEAKVMPRVEKLQAERHEFATARRAAVAHLRTVMNDDTASPAEVEKALEKVRRLESDFRDREESLRADINADLDPRQQARLYFFEKRFRRDMQRRLLNGGGPWRGPGPHGGPGSGGGGATGPAPDPPTTDGGADIDL